MPQYRVYYAREIPDLKTPPATRATLAQTHVLVHELDAGSVGEVFLRMQAESWPSTDEMLAFGERVYALGSFHTTMCTGDVVEDVPTGTCYQATFFDGWRELEEQTMTIRRFSMMGSLAAGPYEIMIAEAAAADDLLAGEAGLREIVDRLRQHYGAMYEAPDAQWIELHAWETDLPGDEVRAYHIERGSGAAAPPPDPEDVP